MSEQATSESRRARYSVVKIGEPSAELEPKDIRLFTNADETIYIFRAFTEEKYPDVRVGNLYDGGVIASVVRIVDKEGRGAYEISIWLPRDARYLDSDITTRYGPLIIYIDYSSVSREIIMDKETDSGHWVSSGSEGGP